VLIIKQEMQGNLSYSEMDFIQFGVILNFYGASSAGCF